MVLTGTGVEHLFAERHELRQRARLVLAYEAAVTDHVGRQDRPLAFFARAARPLRPFLLVH